MNGQKEKLAEKIDIKTVKVGEGDSAAEIAAAKLDGHGIIAKDKTGKLLTKVDGHTYGQEKVDEVIALILEKG